MLARVSYARADAVRIFVDADIELEVEVSYLDEDLSHWDPETRKYDWKHINTNLSKYETRIQFVLDLDISNLDIDWDFDTTTENGMKKLDEWAKQDTEVIEMTEMPSSISLLEDDMISTEEIDSKDYPGE